MPVDPALRDVEKRAKAHERSRSQLWAAIRAAHDQGRSLRAIAAAAALSHEQVRRIVAAQKR
jgi:hypothetical protein